MLSRPYSAKRWLPLAVYLVLLFTALHITVAPDDTDSAAENLATMTPSTMTPSASMPAPSPAPTLSGCQVCASAGDCSHAYLDGPGKFCGNWYDAWAQRQRCCCPFAAKCYVTNYACKCRETAASRIKNSNTGGASARSSSTPTVLIVLSIIGTIGACIGCARCLCHRQPQGYTKTPEVVYAPVAVGSPANIGYGSGRSFNNHYYNNDSGGGGASSALLGGTAGFVGGMFVGHALADSGHSDGPSGYDEGGASGDDGGGDCGGDF